VIIISHRRTPIAHVDRVVELEQGRVINCSP
jgi:ABC-type transport system involved in cytochrome bd biosynthesis fused ATPase/permease subunit